VHAAATRVVRNHLAYTGPILIDARMKPWYPKEVTCRPDVADMVSRRWREYFANRDVDMGDAERGHLD
jgi:4-hydroxybenzoate decarboxylase subunit C